MNSQILATAFEQLQFFDLVLGPAIDGGYYLIGLRQPIPELFVNIEWGTAQVFQKTVDIAQSLIYHFVYLPALADVDRPEDLPIWEQILEERKMSLTAYLKRLIYSEDTAEYSHNYSLFE